jgi:hypothetical protein
VLQNSFRFGMASDGDSLDERYAGISARYENKHVGTDRVGLKFQFDSYHDQWNSSTLDALAAGGSKETSDAYRTRQNFQPAVTIALAKPLTLEVGGEFRAIWRTVSGRAHRGLRRPDCYSALSSAPGGIGQPARPGRKLQLGRGHQNPGQRLRVHVAPGVCGTSSRTASTC